jgi:hypothetical protein
MYAEGSPAGALLRFGGKNVDNLKSTVQQK